MWVNTSKMKNKDNNSITKNSWNPALRIQDCNVSYIDWNPASHYSFATYTSYALHDVSYNLGPKWKTFIRKISGYGRKQQQQKNRFQYDEHSYALNFNSGAQSEDDDMPPSFSARFSAPFPSTRRQTEQWFVRACFWRDFIA